MLTEPSLPTAVEGRHSIDLSLIPKLRFGSRRSFQASSRERGTTTSPGAGRPCLIPSRTGRLSRRSPSIWGNGFSYSSVSEQGERAAGSQSMPPWPICSPCGVEGSRNGVSSGTEARPSKPPVYGNRRCRARGNIEPTGRGQCLSPASTRAIIRADRPPAASLGNTIWKRRWCPRAR